MLPFEALLSADLSPPEPPIGGKINILNEFFVAQEPGIRLTKRSDLQGVNNFLRTFLGLVSDAMYVIKFVIDDIESVLDC